MRQQTPLFSATLLVLFALGHPALAGLFGGFGRTRPKLMDSLNDTKWTHYHDQEEMETALIVVNSRCPNNTRLYRYDPVCWMFTWINYSIKEKGTVL